MVENPGLMEFKYLNPLPLEQSNYYHQLNGLITSSDDQQREVCWDEKNTLDTMMILFICETHLISVLSAKLKVRRRDVVGISEIRFKLANNSPQVGIISTDQIDQAWLCYSGLN